MTGSTRAPRLTHNSVTVDPNDNRPVPHTTDLRAVASIAREFQTLLNFFRDLVRGGRNW